MDIKHIADIRPSKRQLKWQQLEFYGFIHFGINTFADREWGLGTESPSLFNPTELDAVQWVRAFASAGMRGLILTCKHHDGFCLWPTKYTDYSVKRSPWRGGRGDLVREVADACQQYGLKFGIYLSPWDRHEPTYGDSERYNQFYLNQLEELLTGYGEIFSVWLDGACGEGPNGKRQVYSWDAYYRLIRRLQPDAVISVCGPDVRWCGNEAGKVRPEEWSVVPAALQRAERVQEKSQKVDDGRFGREISSQDLDLGSRKAIAGIRDLVWYPAEVNTSIRPGWFYHSSEDGKVRSLCELLEIYFGAVGGNAVLLLNVPPDKRSLIHENDAARLQELGDYLRRLFRDNLAARARFTYSTTAPGWEGRPYWRAPDGVEQAEIEVDLGAAKTFDTVVLGEAIELGQRIEAFSLSILQDEEWQEVYSGTVVGYKKIGRFEPATARYVRLSIKESRYFPTLKTFELYLRPRLPDSVR